MGRSFKDSILNPLERTIPAGLSPSAITGISLIPGLATAVCAAAGWWGWSIGLFAINRVLDGLDGIVARRRGTQSDFGGYLDIMADFTVYAAIPIGVWLGARGIAGDGGATAGALPLVVLLAVFYVNAASWMYLSAILEKRGAQTAAAATARAPLATSVTMPSGVVEGTETILFFALFLLFPAQYAILFWVMAGATAAGVVQRLIWAAKTLL
ncbi:MAG: CDP-alcohol phosphatidyltransferase family protein [Alkalispirochaeta sp.]